MGKFIDLTGRRFGKLVVLCKTDERDAAGGVMWLCRCDCGKEKAISSNSLRRGLSKSCGCQQIVMEDLTGQRFGRLVVTSLDKYNTTSHSTRWNCICDCGKKKSILASCLKSGNTVSCGCYSSEQKSRRSWKHGVGNENRLYRIWSGMKTRCYSPSDRNYKRYGARGITICQEWLSDFTAFQSWAVSHGYQDDLSIDRIDNDGPYCPENCRWSTRTVQNNNRRPNVYITYKGETHTLAEWSRITGINQATLAQRKRAGWSDIECIEVPVRPENNQTTRKTK